MTFEQLKTHILQAPEYEFLKTNPKLGDNLILLGLGGSWAYGTNTPESDIDVRGIAANTYEEMLTGTCFEQVLDNQTDTTIYSLNKIIKLLTDCNPNTIEILGLKPEHYIYLTEIGKELLDNRDLFLSKKAASTFGGYAYAQLRRLSNKAVRKVGQSEEEEHILHSVENAARTFPEKYFEYPQDSIKLYVEDSPRDDFEREIFMDINLHHYPLRDWKGMWSEMNNVVKDYASLGHRNKNAAARGKIGKHQMHLIRLYMMAIDILRDGKIITYREKEHDLLMQIRNNAFLDDNDQPTNEFKDMVEDYRAQMEKAIEQSELPDKPRYKDIKKFQFEINKKIVEGDF